MPDWFYRTVARRGLFCLPDRTARAVALGVIGTLGRSAPGRALIDFMGHMDPDPRLGVRVGGVDFPSPFGLGWRVDPEQRATHGLARFGVGCIEVRAEGGEDVRRGEGESLCDRPGAPPQSHDRPVIDRPLLCRRVMADGREVVELPSGLALPVVAADEYPPADAGVLMDGVVLQSGTRETGEGWRVPAGLTSALPDKVRVWRARLPAGAALIVAGGVAGPDDALALLAAGADLILVEAGLVFRGPGLVKRCNEALLARDFSPPEPPPAGNIFRLAWVWAFLLGAAMALGGLATLGLAVTRVLLPYDEHYLGLTAETLQRNSPRLFAFMAHDRGTLAGVMLGLGWLYMLIARQGVRRGVLGARTAVSASALAGFASFFAFFGFGYFDTLHAFVAAMLFQLTIQVMVGRAGGAPGGRPVVDLEDAAWHRAQWGQLCWVVHAVGLLLAGCLILGIGMSSVFVQEDLDFLCLTAEQAQGLGARMIGVVAHDRATLGGMLLASGVAMLLPVLWCYRRGADWVWTAMAGLGLPAYAAAIGLHLWVGYTDWRHLVPALVGLILWLAGMGLTRQYLRADR